MTENSWFCNVHRHHFDFKVTIRLNENSRHRWAIWLVADASGKPDCEDFGNYAALTRAKKKTRNIFDDLMALPSL